MMRPEESVELSRCVYRSYGYSYDWDYVYYPDRIRELQELPPVPDDPTANLVRSYLVTHLDADLRWLDLALERLTDDKESS